MKRLRRMIGAATTALMILTGCAGNPPSAATSNGVAGAQVALTAAEKAALTYSSLPQCPKQAPLCSDAATIGKIKSADTAAYNAVKAARLSLAAADVVTANGLIAALVSIIPDPAPASAPPN